jgi:23S rRNA (guanosine2251-2'-O)-methyltransferase
MEKLSMAALGRMSVDEFKNESKLPIILVLDNIRSGLNIGSIFRSADAFLIEKIVLCGITAQPPHREILKTALGSTDSVDWIYFSHNTEAVQYLKGLGWTMMAVEQTEPRIWLHDFQPESAKKYAFILGNEVEGVDDALLPLCDGCIEIPQFGTKHSLNVAVSAGIVLWEVGKKMRL